MERKASPRTCFRCDSPFVRMAALVLFACLASLRADQIEMKNGDRYVGQVLSMGQTSLVLRSDVLGTVTLARARVARISLVAEDPAPAALPVPAVTNAPAGLAKTGPEIPAMLRQLASNSNLIQQVQARFLSDAGPEAQQKFNDLVGSLASGRLNLGDLRSQAQSVAQQARAARKELGDDAGFMLDSYLAILDRFVKETPPAESPASALQKPVKRAPPLEAEED